MTYNKTKLSISIGLILFLLFTTLSCHRKGTITYPVSANYGENILTMNGELIKGESYSFEADLSKNSNLTITLTNTSEQDSDLSIPKPRWAFMYLKGWTAGNYNAADGTQSFTTTQIGNNDFKIVFQGSPGSCNMEFFENKSTVTNVKHFTW